MFHKKLVLLLLSLLAANCFAQKHNSSGYIHNHKNDIALANVNISVVGESVGGVSNTEGYFNIQVSKLPALLFFSHIGYSIEQISITEANRRKIKVFLVPEVTTIDEIVVSAKPIQQVKLGDTLNVIDYSFNGDRMILVASPFRKELDQRIYLTDLNGTQIDALPMKQMGKQIKIPEHMMPEHVFLYEDFMGAFHILTRKDVQQIDISGDTIGISYSTSYPEFLSYLLPYKIRSGQSLIFQKSSRTENVTFRSGPDAYRPQKVKTVNDPPGGIQGSV